MLRSKMGNGVKYGKIGVKYDNVGMKNGNVQAKKGKNGVKMAESRSVKWPCWGKKWLGPHMAKFGSKMVQLPS